MCQLSGVSVEGCVRYVCFGYIIVVSQAGVCVRV